MFRVSFSKNFPREDVENFTLEFSKRNPSFSFEISEDKEKNIWVVTLDFLFKEEVVQTHLKIFGELPKEETKRKCYNLLNKEACNLFADEFIAYYNQRQHGSESL